VTEPRTGRRQAWTALVACLSLLGAGCGSSTHGAARSSSSNQVSTTGIHWHVKLTIEVNSKSQTIPADIGIGPSYRANPTFDTTMGMTGIHTHDATGLLHWELMDGPVTRADIELGDFFKVWGQPFTATKLLGYRNGASGHVSMTVNRKPNTRYDRYQIRDGDEIVIRYA
jgi:hypothetical protein